MRRGVEHRGEIGDQHSLLHRQPRRHVLAGAVHDQPGVDELGVQAAELGELGRPPELMRLPAICLSQPSRSVVGVDCADPDHGRTLLESHLPR